MPTAARVLLADDNELNRKVISAFFDHLGVALDIVSDGGSALEQLTNNEYDLALLDIQMPVMSGFEVVEAIAARPEPAPWLVALTATAVPGADQRYQDAGFDEFVSKPLGIATIEALLLRRGVLVS